MKYSKALTGVLAIVVALPIASLAAGCSSQGGVGLGGAGGISGNGGFSGGGGSEGLFPCTEQGLRDAIAEGGGPHSFGCEGRTTIVSLQPFTIDEDVILDGGGLLVVERGPWWQIGQEPDSEVPIFEILATGAVEITGLWISGGGSRALGVSNAGDLTLRDCRVFGSVSIGVKNTGTMDIESCQIEGQGDFSAAVENWGILSLAACQVSGTIRNEVGKLELVGSSVEGNVWNGGDVSAIASSISGGAEAISNRGTLTMVNSSVVGSGTVIHSSAINPWVESALSLTHCTVARDFGDAPSIQIGRGTTFGTTATIIEGGCAADDDQRETEWISGGYNVESPGNTCRLEEDSDRVYVPLDSLRLGSLSDNGGATPTLALLPGSEAIDLTPSGSCGVDEDQRGIQRPQGEGCDAGAFEWEPELVGETCAVSDRECLEAPVDPILETCELEAPSEPNACDGTESWENPLRCDGASDSIKYRLTGLRVAGDCDHGFDLDQCGGATCLNGGLASGDGADGVDNQLAGAGAIFDAGGVCTANLGMINQVLHDAICSGDLDMEIEVDMAEGAPCALLTLVVDDVATNPVPMRLSEDGCLSGTLGRLPLRINGFRGVVSNAILTATVSPTGISNGIVGGTVTDRTLEALFEVLCPGAGAVAQQFADISAALYRNSSAPCDALSVAFELEAIPTND